MTSDNLSSAAAASGTFLIGGDISVNRLGFGSMQLTGRNGFGPSRDANAARAVLRRAVELGVTLIDTADAYGPGVAEELIGEALAPYKSDVVVATKGGYVRSRRGDWITDGRPEHLREAVEGSLQRLRLEVIDLYQLHRIDGGVPLADQIGALLELRNAGKIRHIGLSEVSVEQIEEASSIAPISTVQNLYNLGQRGAESVVRYAEERGIGFIPWFPLATGGLTKRFASTEEIGSKFGATPSQVALAWLLQHSTTMLPIPGTSSVDHLEENVAASGLRLDSEAISVLDQAA